MKTKLFLTMVVISLLATSLLNAQSISLYALSNSIPDNGSLQYNIINPYSAQATAIDAINGLKDIYIGSSTFDYSCSHYMFSGNDSLFVKRLFVVDTNATIISNPIISNSYNIYGLQYDMNNHVFYALIQDNVTSVFNIGIINPNTADVNLIHSLPELNSISSAAYTYNSNTGKYIFCGTDNNNDKRLYCINVQDGTIESNPLANDSYFSALQYDNIHNKLYGLYRDTLNLFLFNFVEIDLLSADVVILNPLNEISSINIGSSVFDQSTGTFIFRGADTSNVNRLYLINSNNGQIISNSPLSGNIIEIECDNTKFAKAFYTNIQEEKPIFNDLSIYPNPASEKFNLEFTVSNPQDISIRVVNSLGQIVYRESHKNYQGKYSGNIDTRSFATGVYALNIKVGENTNTQNITVIH